MVSKIVTKTRMNMLAVSVCVVIPLIAGCLSVAPGVKKAQGNAQKASCLSNLKQTSLAMLMYACDYDGAYPTPNNWNEPLKPYIRTGESLWCPAVEGDLPSYAVNAGLVGRNDNTLKEKESTVMFFDSTPGKKIVGGVELLPAEPRHEGCQNIAFADGHAKSLTDKEARALPGWKVKK